MPFHMNFIFLYFNSYVNRSHTDSKNKQEISCIFPAELRLSVTLYDLCVFQCCYVLASYIWFYILFLYNSLHKKTQGTWTWCMISV